MNKDVILGIMIPFIGTSLGAACVYIMKGELKEKVQKGLSGFAAGVMVAASIWSLLMPAMDMVEDKMGKMSWIPAAVGFLVGIFFLLFLDSVIPHQHIDSDHPEGMKAESLRKTTMMVLAVIIHNIPEGMAVGVSFAGVLYGNTHMTMAGAIVLSIGIAIQNFPRSHHIYAPKGSRSKQAQGIWNGHIFRCSRANRSNSNHNPIPLPSSNPTLSSSLRSRGNDVCSSRRTSTRSNR